MKEPTCGNGSPCVYLGKELGWEKYVESETLKLAPKIQLANWNHSAPTIFVAISAYRDELCSQTLVNMFTKALFPNRIHVAVVQQNAPGDEDCVEVYCKKMANIYHESNCTYFQNIKIERVSAEDAKGPTWARAKGSTMLQNEEFCMQIDAHMDFVEHWDIKMLKMWSETNNEYAVLSTYVTDSGELPRQQEDKHGTNNLYEVPHLCMANFLGENGLVRNWGTKCMRMMPHPKLTNAIWGAGLSFAKCHAERKVPYDPHTPHIFDGEEFSRAARYWTWGYDIYTPHRVYVVHNYHVSQADPKHMGWTVTRFKPGVHEVEQSVLRLRALLEMPPFSPSLNQVGDIDHKSILGNIEAHDYVTKVQTSRYGLGDRRTLDQLLAFSGIDTKNLKTGTNRCGNIDYIPFKEHPWGVSYVPKYDPVTEQFVDVRDPGSIYFDQKNQNMVHNWQAADTARKASNQKKVVNSVAKASPSHPAVVHLMGSIPEEYLPPFKRQMRRVREQFESIHQKDGKVLKDLLPPFKRNEKKNYQSEGLNGTSIESEVSMSLFILFCIVLMVVARITCSQQKNQSNGMNKKF